MSHDNSTVDSTTSEVSPIPQPPFIPPFTPDPEFLLPFPISRTTDSVKTYFLGRITECLLVNKRAKFLRKHHVVLSSWAFFTQLLQPEHTWLAEFYPVNISLKFACFDMVSPSYACEQEFFKTYFKLTGSNEECIAQLLTFGTTYNGGLFAYPICLNAFKNKSPQPLQVSKSF